MESMAGEQLIGCRWPCALSGSCSWYEAGVNLVTMSTTAGQRQQRQQVAAPSTALKPGGTCAPGRVSMLASGVGRAAVCIACVERCVCVLKVMGRETAFMGLFFSCI
jgi:hypothetical protein